jgi:MraZ protein
MHLTGFFGRYTTTIDEKGRCILPAKLRAVTDDAEKPLLAGEIFLTKGLEGCLAVYPQKEWDAIQQRMSTLEFTDRSYRSFSRRFYSFAAPVVADKNGRILIPAHLIAEADLDKELEPTVAEVLHGEVCRQLRGSGCQVVYGRWRVKGVTAATISR